MTRTRKALLGLLLLLSCLGLCIWLMTRSSIALKKDAPTPVLPHPEITTPPLPLPGEQILRDYASDSVRPEDDLSMMAHALSNLTLLIKGPDPIRLGANEEIAGALLGQNRARLVFLPKAHRAFNARGQLVDRWQSPLFFHAESRDRIDIRSAGPDRVLWTADDLHRRHDGRFLIASELNPASLSNHSPGASAGR